MNQVANKTQDDKNVPKYLFKVEDDGRIFPRPAVGTNVVVRLPAAVYSLQYDKDIGVFLKPERNFSLPDRIYGKVKSHADHFLRSYELNDKNLGVMLIGEPGSGKTLTLKQLAAKAIELDMPIILVNHSFSGQAMIDFFNSIDQDCVVALDEFDKSFASQNASGNGMNLDAQNTLITLLDGTATSPKKLFVLTANDDRLISRFFKDRPSRIRYTIRYKRIEMSAMVEYVEANLKDMSDDHLRAFVHLTLADGGGSSAVGTSDGLNFDSVRELVTEMNQFKCSLDDAAEIMLQAGNRSYVAFEVMELIDGQPSANRFTAQASFTGSYMKSCESSIRVRSFVTEEPEVKEDETASTTATAPKKKPKTRNDRFVLTQKHFVSFGPTLDTLIYAYEGKTYQLRYLGNREYARLDDLIDSKINTSSSLAEWSVIEQGGASAKEESGNTISFPDPSFTYDLPQILGLAVPEVAGDSNPLFPNKGQVFIEGADKTGGGSDGNEEDEPA